VKTIKSCLADWSIDRILTITLNNASSNDNVINYLEIRTKDWKFIVPDNEFIHIRCCACIVNFLVRDGLKK
jgi:hypothetical protein